MISDTLNSERSDSSDGQHVLQEITEASAPAFEGGVYLSMTYTVLI